MRALVVTEGFGELKPGIERRVGWCTFRLYRGAEGDVYESRCEAGGEARMLVANGSLKVVPAPPVFAEPRVSRLVMLKLREPLVIGGRGSARIRACIPVDAVVVASDGSVVEARPLHRVKYALYGAIDRGVLARVAWSDVDPPCASVELRVVNTSDRTIVVRRVVFPGYMLGLCYRGSEVYANPLKLAIMGDLGIVQPEQGDWPEGCTEAPRLLRAPMFEKQRYAMMHGF